MLPIRGVLSVCVALSWVLPAAADDAPSDAEALQWQRADVRVYREKFLAVDRSFDAAARAEAEARLSRIENASEPLSPAQFAVELCRITALADNAHTRCLPARVGRAVCAEFAALIAEDAPWCEVREPDFAVPEFTRVPITFEVFGEEFHVVRIAAEHAELLGARLISVNGRPMERLRPVLRTFSGGTLESRDAIAAGVLSSPQQLHAVGLSERDDSLQYQFQLRGGRTLQRHFAAQSATEQISWRSIPFADQAPWSLREPEKAFRFRDAPEVDALVVQLRQILDTEEQGIADFLESMEQRRSALGRENIVLDMRANGGGNLLLAREFMIEWPRRMPGKFYVLTSRETFSAAMASIAYLKQAAGERVVIVGEAVGDRMVFFSDGLPVQLPHSDLFFLPAVVRMDFANGCRAFSDCFEAIVAPGQPAAVSLLKLPPDLQRVPIAVGTLEPDVHAPWTVDSWLEGRDPAMAAVIEMRAQE